MRVLGDTMVQPRISRAWWPNAEEKHDKHDEHDKQPVSLSPEALPGASCAEKRDKLTGSLLSLSSRSRLEGNAVKSAAQKVAAVTLASTIGVFGSSQIAFAAALASDFAEKPVIEAPGTALAETPLDAGDGAGTDSDSKGTAPKPDAESESSPADPATDGASAGADATAPSEPCDDLTDIAAAAAADEAEAEADGAPIEAQALEAASFADRANEALAASSNAEVILDGDETLDGQITIPANKTLTVDLNGYTLTCTGGTPFAMGGDASTLTINDSSTAKTGVLNASRSTLLSQDGFQKANFNLINGHISCQNLGSSNFVQFTLLGGSVSMSTRMLIADPTRVDIQGTCSVSSSASTGAFRVNSGVVSVASTARVTYTGAGAIFDLNGGSVVLGSGATASGNITATTGNIVLFEKKNSSATINNPNIICGSDPVFKSSGTGSDAKITFISGTLPDDSMKDFLGAGLFCFHVPGGGYLVHDQSFVNDQCVGVADGVYYYSEDDFAKVTGSKTAYNLANFAFDTGSFAPALAGKAQHVHVYPGTKLADVPLFTLDTAPAVDGYTFYWVRSSTGAKYTADQVLSMPITEDYSFVGRYEANPVSKPDPVMCDVTFHWGSAYVGDDGADSKDAKLLKRSVEQGKTLAGLAPTDAEAAVSGYKFLGWYDAAGNKLNASSPVQANTVYTARYERVSGPVVGPTDPGTDPDPVDPGVDPGTSITGPGTNPANPNPAPPQTNITGSDSSAGGSGGSVGGGSASGSGLRTPSMPVRSSGWLPADLAMAAGFTVPESGPGVVVLDAFGEPVVAGAGDGAGDGVSEDDIPLFDAEDMDSSALPFSGADVVRTIALLGGVALAALIAVRVGSFMAANASVGRKRRRKALGLE